MNTQYDEFVRKLAKSGAAIRVGLANVSDDAIDRLHAVIGIVGEVGEFVYALEFGSEEQVKEELGDILFYTEYLRQHADDASGEYGGDYTDALKALRHSSVEMLDICKKECIYAKELNIDQINRFRSHHMRFLRALGQMISGYGHTVEGLQAANVEKLSKRYPGQQYSDAAAAARVDKIGTEDDAA